MSRSVLLSRLPFLFLVVCGSAFLSNSFSHSAAATLPQGEITSTIANSGWVINEFHSDPANDLAGDANGDGLRDAQYDEFIELFNDTGAAADISGWTLADEFETRHLFPEGSIVPDQCAIVVFGGGVPTGMFGNAVVQVASSGGLALDNTGDTIAMSNGPDTIQSVVYGFEGNEDQSLTRNPDVSGDFARHLEVNDRRFSPGTRLDGAIFGGCPGYDLPPLVLEMQPADGAMAVANDSDITVLFSEPVTISEPWYEIACTKSGFHTAVTSGNAASYTLTPETSFVYEEDCQVTLMAAAITDLDGQTQPMETDVQWQFGTEREPDNAPQVMDSFPTDGANGIARAATLAISFSEPVNLSETAVELECSHSGIVPLAFSGGPSQFQVAPATELEMGELCTLTVAAEGVNDLDGNDPPDQMTADWQISFSTEAADFLLINEVDSKTPGIDGAEFIELFDGGRGRTQLDGLSIVLFSGHNNSAYAGFDLAGWQTDDNGYFLLGSRGVVDVDLVMDDTLLQNGVDAVALYLASAAEIPVGTAVTTDSILDAVVYGADPADSGLLILLHSGEELVNENSRTLDEFHSLQRCPDGSGGQRRTGTYWADLPTPKEANTCVKDEAPQISAVTPADGANGVSLDSELTVTFSEEVAVNGEWFNIDCESSGRHEAASSGGGVQYSLRPAKPFAYGEECRVTILADQVRDLDTGDPPDNLSADYSWTFTAVPARHMLINEVDADTPGADTAEFIELYDGGQGNTALDGLVLVLFNGAVDLSYRTIDLNGQQTDAQGRFVAGNTAVPGVDLALPDGAIQNGPDAVALYEGDGADFPNGSAISAHNLLDAVVYGAVDNPDGGLLALLGDGQRQLDENSRGNAGGDSNQRCPDGAGEQRQSSPFVQNLVTPGLLNRCTFDTAPSLIRTTPRAGDRNVAVDSPLTLNFSEAVEFEENWFTLVCEKTGSPEIGVRHTDDLVTLKPQNNLLHNDLCTVTVLGSRVRDSDQDDPPDNMAGNYTWSFETVALPVARHVLINEVDADTPGVDTAEFIELFDGGRGSTALDGLEIVLYNGADDRAYRQIDLTGYQTNATGYFVIGGSGVPNVNLIIGSGVIQNGVDAAALYVKDESSNNGPSEIGLLDALVYHTNDEADPGLNFLLLENEPQVNEGRWRDPAVDSNQRCPNGQGGQRVTSGYVQNQPTPGTANNCTMDKPPQIVQVFPADGSLDVPLNSGLVVHFDEPVQVGDTWIKLFCEKEGAVNLAITGGPAQYVIQPASLAPLDNCRVTVFGAEVHDLDGYTDALAGDYRWHFTTGDSKTAVSAGFTSTSPATIGDPLWFTNISKGPQPLTYKWDFGDGSPLVSEFEPLHIYAHIGVYTVTLTVMTSGGETATYNAPVEILPARIYMPMSKSS